MKESEYMESNPVILDMIQQEMWVRARNNPQLGKMMYMENIKLPKKKIYLESGLRREIPVDVKPTFSSRLDRILARGFAGTKLEDDFVKLFYGGKLPSKKS
ncbi:MAG: hypothetical protein ACTSRA_00240 [Promethearchaeota archaeon]|nr:MAG: hypothetical protein [Helarchaeota virus Nidhogg Meg22_1012]URC17383.1 MAG: hypothetical protein [Helarchaeota virus Nidhogg Meg22_1214]